MAPSHQGARVRAQDCKKREESAGRLGHRYLGRRLLGHRGLNTSTSNAVSPVPVSPGRTNAGTMEDPRPSATVAPTHCSSPRSRPGPVCRTGEGVLQPALAGMYAHRFEWLPSSVDFDSNFSTPIEHLHSTRNVEHPLDDFVISNTAGASAHFILHHERPTSPAEEFIPEHRLQRTYSSMPRLTHQQPLDYSAPGRMHGSREEDPLAFDTVAPCSHPESSRRRSRPGPVLESGEGIFRPTLAGMYPCFEEHLASSDYFPSNRTPSRVSQPCDQPPPSRNPPPSTASHKASGSFTTYYQNVRGLRTKTNDLQLSLSACDCDVVAFTETWLHNDIANSELTDAYNIYRGDRSLETSSLSRGGGVLLAIKNNLSCEEIKLANSARLEQVAVRVKLPAKSFFICCVYIRPNSDPGMYVDHCRCVHELCELAGLNDTIVVLGDYNLPNLQWIFDEELNGYIPSNASTEQEVVMVESMLETGLYQVFDLHNANERLLDLAFISEPERFELFEPPVPLLRPDAHHRPYILKYDAVAMSNDSDGQVLYDFNNCDIAAANARIANINWNALLDNCPLNEAVSRFYDILSSIIIETVPVRPQTPLVNQHQPWWNRTLRKLRNKLRRIRKRFFKRRTLKNYQNLLRHEQEYENLNIATYRQYICRIESQVKDNPSSFWSYVKKRRKTAGVPLEMTYENSRANNAQASADLFANFFSSVHSSVPPPTNNVLMDRIPNYVLHLPVLRVNTDDVARAFASIDTRKGPGPDGIPPSFIANCAQTLAVPLSTIYNRSLEIGVFPSVWKLASITPIFKSGNVHKVENYRAISILDSFAKIFERLVHNVLYSAVRPIISDFQHGFIKKRSATSNLMSFVSTVINRIEKGQQTDAIYVDFAKAFDKVPHTIAIEKLRCYGLPEWIVSWLQSYLSERSAYVKVQNAKSTRFHIPSGVPQGSILGPLIFTLFINDLCDVIRSEKLMYADDLKIFRPVIAPMDHCALQNDVDALQQWCAMNGMEMNASKCSVITFSRSQSPMIHDYHVATGVLPRTDLVKDLGVLIDSKARFNQHIATVTAKAFATLGFIRRNTADFTDLYALKSLFCSLVRSQLEYAVQVWAPYHIQQTDRIESVQRAFLRYACRNVNWGNIDHRPSYSDRCTLANMSTLESRRIFLRRILIFDVLSGNIDCSDLLYRVNIHASARRLRDTTFLRIPGHRSSYGYNEPFCVCCRLFNDVQHLFDFNLSKETFKFRIRNLV